MSQDLLNKTLQDIIRGGERESQIEFNDQSWKVVISKIEISDQHKNSQIVQESDSNNGPISQIDDNVYLDKDCKEQEKYKVKKEDKEEKSVTLDVLKNLTHVAALYAVLKKDKWDGKCTITAYCPALKEGEEIKIIAGEDTVLIIKHKSCPKKYPPPPRRS